MKKLFTNEQFENAKSKDLLPCECYNCNKTFYKTKHLIQMGINPNHRNKGKYCSIKCQRQFEGGINIVKCKNCNKSFKKRLSQIKKSPNHFCCMSCAALYNNTHKNFGIRRSKLEIYLEEQLTILHPKLHIDYNKKNVINSELDIFIPSLNIAFELNGIFHYQPIFGQKKFVQILNNDEKKLKYCIQKKIHLHIINVSKMNYFKREKAQNFLNIILDIIKKMTI